LLLRLFLLKEITLWRIKVSKPLSKQSLKLFVFLPAVFFLTVSGDKCNDKKDGLVSYKARLEIKALCMNYTLRLLEGNLDTALIDRNWTDETTGKSYKNVFGLVNPCDFPYIIKEGGEFRFIIDSVKTKVCPVCLAYYPTPPKKLWVKVIEQ
jgi:hypothetical protein